MQLKNGYKLIYEKADSNGDLHMYASKSTTPTNNDEAVCIHGIKGEVVMGNDGDLCVDSTVFNAVPRDDFPLPTEAAITFTDV